MTPLEVKNLTMASIISAENDVYTEGQKQEIIKRYNKAKIKAKYDWKEIFEPLKEDAHKWVEFFTLIDQQHEIDEA